MTENRARRIPRTKQRRMEMSNQEKELKMSDEQKRIYQKWSDQKKEQYHQRRAVIAEAALKIDPGTAEVSWHQGWYFDPYNFFNDDKEWQDLFEWTYWARSPGSEVWVEFYDLLKVTRAALQQNWNIDVSGFWSPIWVESDGLPDSWRQKHSITRSSPMRVEFGDLPEVTQNALRQKYRLPNGSDMAMETSETILVLPSITRNRR